MPRCPSSGRVRRPRPGRGERVGAGGHHTARRCAAGLCQGGRRGRTGAGAGSHRPSPPPGMRRSCVIAAQHFVHQLTPLHVKAATRTPYRLVTSWTLRAGRRGWSRPRRGLRRSLRGPFGGFGGARREEEGRPPPGASGRKGRGARPARAGGRRACPGASRRRFPARGQGSGRADAAGPGPRAGRRCHAGPATACGGGGRGRRRRCAGRCGRCGPGCGRCRAAARCPG